MILSDTLIRPVYFWCWIAPLLYEGNVWRVFSQQCVWGWDTCGVKIMFEGDGWLVILGLLVCWVLVKNVRCPKKQQQKTWSKTINQTGHKEKDKTFTKPTLLLGLINVIKISLWIDNYPWMSNHYLLTVLKLLFGPGENNNNQQWDKYDSKDKTQQKNYNDQCNVKKKKKNTDSEWFCFSPNVMVHCAEKQNDEMFFTIRTL